MSIDIRSNGLPHNFTIKTERLSLRRPSEDDISHIFTATRHEGFNDGMLWEPPKKIDDLKEPFERNLKAWDAGKSFTFSIDTSEAKSFIGRISIRQIDGDPNSTWNIGFFTIPGFQGKGYMVEAVSAVLQFGFDTLEAEQIEACHAWWNVASKRVLEKNGMTFIKHIPEGFKKNDKWVAEDLLGISLKSWQDNQ